MGCTPPGPIIPIPVSSRQLVNGDEDNGDCFENRIKYNNHTP